MSTPKTAAKSRAPKAPAATTPTTTPAQNDTEEPTAVAPQSVLRFWPVAILVLAVVSGVWFFNQDQPKQQQPKIAIAPAPIVDIQAEVAKALAPMQQQLVKERADALVKANADAAALRDRDKALADERADAQRLREQMAKAETEAKAKAEAAAIEAAKPKVPAEEAVLAGKKVWLIGNGVHVDFDADMVPVKGPEKIHPFVEGQGIHKDGLYPVLAPDGNPLKDTGSPVKLKGAKVLSVKTKRGFESYWFIQ